MTTAGAAKIGENTALPPSLLKDKYPIMECLPDDAEGSLTLCAAVDDLTKPIVAFVRLAESKVFNNALEIPLPLRFMFVVLTPKNSVDIDCHEVGRAFSTLMSSKYLQKKCYSIATKGELLNAVNDFLDESFVLPDIGNWADKKTPQFSKYSRNEGQKKTIERQSSQ